MNPVRTVGALVLTLLAWVGMGAPHGPESAIGERESLAQGKAIETEVSYDVETPAPDGFATCDIAVSFRATRPANVVTTVELVPAPGGGEARMTSVEYHFDGGVAHADLIPNGAGTQPGCDKLPDSPSSLPFMPFISPSTTLPRGSLRLVWELLLHAHPDADCTAAGRAVGTVKFTFEAQSGRLRRADARLVSCR
jgi:hypothetical protein